MIEKQLDLGLQQSILGELSDSASCRCVLFAVESATISAQCRNIVLEQGLILNDVAESLHHMIVASLALG